MNGGGEIPVSIDMLNYGKVPVGFPLPCDFFLFLQSTLLFETILFRRARKNDPPNFVVLYIADGKTLKICSTT